MDREKSAILIFLALVSAFISYYSIFPFSLSAVATALFITSYIDMAEYGVLLSLSSLPSVLSGDLALLPLSLGLGLLTSYTGKREDYGRVMRSFLLSLIPSLVVGVLGLPPLVSFLVFLVVSSVSVALRLDGRGYVISGIVFLLVSALVFSKNEVSALSDSLSVASYYDLLFGVIQVGIDRYSPGRRKATLLSIMSLAFIPSLIISLYYQDLGETPFFFWDSRSFYFSPGLLLHSWIPGVGENLWGRYIASWTLGYVMSRLIGGNSGPLFLGFTQFLAGVSAFALARRRGLSNGWGLGVGVLIEMGEFIGVNVVGPNALGYALTLPFVLVVNWWAERGGVVRSLVAVLVSLGVATDPYSLLLGSIVALGLSWDRKTYFERTVYGLLGILGVNLFWEVPLLLLGDLPYPSLPTSGVQVSLTDPYFTLVYLSSIVISYYGRRKEIGGLNMSLGASYVFGLIYPESLPFIIPLSVLLLTSTGRSIIVLVLTVIGVGVAIQSSYHLYGVACLPQGKGEKILSSLENSSAGLRTNETVFWEAGNITGNLTYASGLPSFLLSPAPVSPSLGGGEYIMEPNLTLVRNPSFSGYPFTVLLSNRLNDTGLVDFILSEAQVTGNLMGTPNSTAEPLTLSTGSEQGNFTFQYLHPEPWRGYIVVSLRNVSFPEELNYSVQVVYGNGTSHFFPGTANGSLTTVKIVGQLYSISFILPPKDRVNVTELYVMNGSVGDLYIGEYTGHVQQTFSFPWYGIRDRVNSTSNATLYLLTGLQNFSISYDGSPVNGTSLEVKKGVSYLDLSFTWDWAYQYSYGLSLMSLLLVMFFSSSLYRRVYARVSPLLGKLEKLLREPEGQGDGDGVST